MIDPRTESADSVSRLQAVLYRLTKSLVFTGHPPAALAELPLSQLRCVRVIGEHEGQKMLELAHELGVTLPALSQIVDRLVRRDMVERHSDSEDRRIVRVFLTDSARNVLRESHEQRRERIARAVAEWKPSETDSAIGAMERLAEAAEHLDAADSGFANDTIPDSAPLADLAAQRAAMAASHSAGLSPRTSDAGQ